MRSIIRLAVLLLVPVSSRADDFSSVVGPIFQKNCISCHGEEKQKGGIVVHDMTSLEAAFAKHELLEEIIEQVRNGDMPPEDEEAQPTDDERKQLIALLEDARERVATGKVPMRAGRTTLRRLNRNEYRNTVRDLYGVKFDPSQGFPADGAGGEGFNNMADALFSSPSLLEKYLESAKKVVAAVYADALLKQQVIFKRPLTNESTETTAREVLAFHATLAYRRRVDEEDMAPLMNAFSRGVQGGLSYQDALRTPLTAILMNPRFLFRAEQDQEGEQEWALGDFEIATRLSYFLWSSMPDRELFRLADAGELHKPEVLREQTLRMIQNPKADALARNFAGQWLGFEKMIDQVQPNPERYPEFDPSLRKSMYYECIEFFSHILRENRPVTDLIDSDYTFANERLARHYGLKEKLTGEDLRKVTLTDPNRGGVLGMGAVLTSTSLPLRTSPVLRGVFVLDALLGDPPPPPPPDAGQLPADDANSEGLTFRQQLDLHRKLPACANCHARIDPLGFSLENYDAIGRWRGTDANGQPLDTTAMLAGDIEFSSPRELKQLIMGGREKFARNMIRKMISYATGRGLEYYDEATVNRILTELEKNDYAMHELVLQVVQSRPFLNRSSTR